MPDTVSSRPASAAATPLLNRETSASEPTHLPNSPATPIDSFNRETSFRTAAHVASASFRFSTSGVTLRAPDGMVIDASAVDTPVEVPRTRAQRIKAGMKAEIPQRIQQGPTCGLYALGMVMDYWHQENASNPTVLVSDKDLGGQGRNYNESPTSDERMLSYVRDTGYTSAGEMFKARDLAETASHFGYTANLYQNATLENLYEVLDAGHPAIVAFDVDYRGNPGDFGGKRAHYAVIQGYFDEDGERYLIAKHGWGGQKDYVWKASDFDTSWKALEATDWYGKPGDGLMPDANYEEPSLLDLPDLGNGQAGIKRSLATKIIEVVPNGRSAVGGQEVA